MGHKIQVAPVRVDVHAAQVYAAGRSEYAHGAVTEPFEKARNDALEEGQAVRHRVPSIRAFKDTPQCLIGLG
jgi:hypothetical protein